MYMGFIKSSWEVLDKRISMAPGSLYCSPDTILLLNVYLNAVNHVPRPNRSLKKLLNRFNVKPVQAVGDILKFQLQENLIL